MIHRSKISTNCTFFVHRSRITVSIFSSSQSQVRCQTVSYCGFKQDTHMFDAHVLNKCHIRQFQVPDMNGDIHLLCRASSKMRQTYKLALFDARPAYIDIILMTPWYVNITVIYGRHVQVWKNTTLLLFKITFNTESYQDTSFLCGSRT